MRITKLDGLRGISSIMIIFQHYPEYLLPDFIYNNFLIKESYAFVDFFFVLSGFIISRNYSLINTTEKLRVFLKKRFVRLYPLLFFTTTVCIIYYFGKNYIESSNLITSRIFGRPENFIPGQYIYKYFDTILLTSSSPIFSNIGGLNGPSWAVSAEMICYIVFGLVSFYAIGKRKNLVLLILLMGGIVFSIFHGSYFNTADYGFVRGLISFIIGYFVWYFSQRKYKFNDKIEFLIPVLLVLLLYVLNVLGPGNDKESFLKQMFGLSFIPLFFGLSILVLLNTNSYISKLLETKPFIFLGKLSYSIYLNQVLLISIIPNILFRIVGLHQNNINEILVMLFLILILVLYSYLTYLIVEEKGGQFLRKRLLDFHK